MSSSQGFTGAASGASGNKRKGAPSTSTREKIKGYPVITCPPPDHIFSLIYRSDELGVIHIQVHPGDLQRPVDIPRILARLETEKGQAEAREWIMIGGGARLFLHQLCSFDIGRTPSSDYSLQYTQNDDDIDTRYLSMDGSMGIQLLKRAIEIFPEAVSLPDALGCYPLHIICNRALRWRRAYLPWRPETKEVFDILYEKHPAAINERTKTDVDAHCDATGETVLHCMLSTRNSASLPGSSQEVFDSILDAVIDLSPNLAAVANRRGLLPLHLALTPAQRDSPKLVRKILPLYPEAAERMPRYPAGYIPTGSYHWDGQTLVHSVLEGCFRMDPSGAEFVHAFLDNVPLKTLRIEDTGLLLIGRYVVGTSFHDIFPSGDALDYVCVMYTAALNGILFHIHGDYDEDQYDIFRNGRSYARPYLGGGFIAANEEYLKLKATGGFERLYRSVSLTDSEKVSFESVFSALLRILHIFVPNAPTHLHAFVSGTTCRPWYLAVMHQIITRYPNLARVRDADGNLPLHLFLLSCLKEKLRAIAKGYAEDKKDYCKAVALCLNILLDANPEAAQIRNGNGVHSLLLAIQHCNVMQYTAIVEPLLKLAPRTLLERDTQTHLFPFALAGAGEMANFNTSYQLLRRDPSALSLQLGGSSNDY